jgi:hypothetical protein
VKQRATRHCGVNAALSKFSQSLRRSHGKRPLGAAGRSGKRLGLDNEFAVKVIKSVSNQGEAFESNVCSGSRRGLIAAGCSAPSVRWRAIGSFSELAQRRAYTDTSLAQ